MGATTGLPPRSKTHPPVHLPAPPPAGDIRYSYHRFGNNSTNKPALVVLQGLGNTQYAWGAAVSRRPAQVVP